MYKGKKPQIYTIFRDGPLTIFTLITKREGRSKIENNSVKQWLRYTHA